MSNVSEAAQRIAEGVNAYYGSDMDGQVVFGRDGSGGQWYSSETYGFGSDVVVLHCGGLQRITPEDAQEILDNLESEQRT